MKNTMKKLNNNKGMSLVELLVVICVIAILTGLMTVSMSIVNNANLSRAANTLSSALSTARAQSMARGSEKGYLHVFNVGNSLYYTIGTGERVKICNNIVKVIPINSATPVEDMSFAYSTVNYYVYFDSAGMVKPAPDGSMPIDELVFCKGNRRVYCYLYKETGKSTTNMYYIN